jgi:hypothetical protein
MFALWDADGNEILSTDLHVILRNPGNSVHNLDIIVGKLNEIGGSGIVASTPWPRIITL